MIMQITKYIFALWAGVLLYSLLSVSFGAKGLSAQRQLEKELEKQEKNIETLKLINKRLTDVEYSLLFDEDTLLVYVREQGYAFPQERFVRIVGLGTNQQNLTNPGTVVTAATPQFFSNQVFRIIALCAGAATLICALIFDLLKYLREK